MGVAGKLYPFSNAGVGITEDLTPDDAVWALRTVDVSAYGGQTVRLLVEAADASSASLVEAAIDDVTIVHQP